MSVHLPPVRLGLVLRTCPQIRKRSAKEHTRVWSEVLQCFQRCHIRNYSIFHHAGMLFGYFEYWGGDYEADMARMAADPATRRWWDLIGPVQPVPPTDDPRAWWVRMDEVFHHDG